MRTAYQKGLVSSYGFTALNIAVQVVLMPLYLRYLGKVQFGILMMLLGYVNYAAVGVNWLTGGLLRIFGAQHAKENLAAFSQAYYLGRNIYVGYAIVTGFAMLIMADVAPAVLLGQQPASVQFSILWAVGATAVYLILFYDLSIDRVALTAIGVQHWAFSLQMAALVIYAVGAVLVLMAGGSVVELMAVMALGALAAIVWARRIWAGQSFAPSRRAIEDTGHRAELLKSIFGRQGMGYLVYGIMVLTMQADVLFLGWLGGAAVAAEYVVVWKAAEVAVFILWRIPETRIPELIRADARNDSMHITKLFWRTWRWTFGLSVLGGIAYALLGRTVVGLWLGEAALPHAPYAFWLAGAALFFLSATRPAAIYAYATARFRELLPVAGLELSIKLLVLYWMFPKVGILAPMVGLITAHVVGVFPLYWRLAPKPMLR